MEEPIVGCVGSIVEKIAEKTFAAGVRCLTHDYTNNMENLQNKMKDFQTAKDALQSRVDEAKRDGGIIKEEVQSWIHEAARISKEAKTFLDKDCKKADFKCFCGSLPNLMSRRRLSKRVKDKAEQIAITIQDADGDQFRTIALRPALQSCITDRDGYEEFESRKKVLKEIMNALSCDEVRKVGVYGMGGVGKTMIAKEVARLATEMKLFSEVAIFTVSQKQDLRAIQQAIAEKIRIADNVRNIESVEERADRLKRRLKEEKSILIILDDLWAKLDLKEVGLNFDHDQKGCKILITSRSLDVTHKSMEAEKSILVGVLDTTEARDLFIKIVGANVEPDFYQLADDVVKECGGLPLAINVVANALKDEELAIWNDALNRLRNPAPTNIDETLAQVYSKIRLSFDFLKSEEAKKLLLLCSLYGEDEEIQVNELTMLILGLGDFVSVEVARDRVEALVAKLKDQCLLLDGDKNGYVKLHDVIRDVATVIALEDSWGMHSFMIDNRLGDRISDIRHKVVKALALLENSESTELPEIKLEFPQLELFLFDANVSYFSSRTIDLNIVEILKGSVDVKVLCLIHVDPLSLPTPLNFLQSLKTLRLCYCILDGDIDNIVELKNLRVLDLSQSTIVELPLNFEKLTRLQLLDLRGCENFEVIRENVFSSLTELEELYMPSEFRKWGQIVDDIKNANVDELMHLRKLTTLWISVKILPRGFKFGQKLASYNLGIGCDYDERHEYYGERISRRLTLQDCEGSPVKAPGIEALIKNKQLREVNVSYGEMKNLFPLSIAKTLHKIELFYCEMMENIVALAHDEREIDEVVFDQLRYLRLWDLPNLVKFMITSPNPSGVTTSSSSAQTSDCYLFGGKVTLPKLETLILKGIDVKRLWADKFPSNSNNCFQNLTHLEIIEGSQLEYVSSVDAAKSLKKLSVEYCESMEVIFKVNLEQDGTSVLLSQLKSLSLEGLPNLKIFCGTFGKERMHLVSEQPLFNAKMLPNLEELGVNDINITKLWNERPSETNYHNLKLLTIRRCKNLKYVWSTSTVLTSFLPLLESLEIRECEDIEEIVSVTEEAGFKPNSSSVSLLFPKLTSLILDDLPNLKLFCRVENVNIPWLSKLSIIKCQKMRVFSADYAANEEPLDEMYLAEQPFFSNKVVFPKLEKLSLDGIDKVKKLWADKLPLTSNNCFQNLKSLKLERLPNLKIFCGTFDKEMMHLICDQPLFSGKMLPNLKELYVSQLNIIKLWDESLSAPNYHNLKELSIKGCDNLKYVLNLASAVPTSFFQVLESLIIERCQNIEEIVSSQSVSLSFPKLTYLTLEGLPNLKLFCRAESVKFPLLTSLIIEDLPNLQLFCSGESVNFSFLTHLTLEDLPNLQLFCRAESVEFPSLSELSIKKCHKMRVFSADYATNEEPLDEMNLAEQPFFSNKVAFFNLTLLNIVNCGGFKYLLDSSTAKSLTQLEKMFIMVCKKMKEIIIRDCNKDETREDEVFDFKSLEILVLRDLDNLESFYFGNNGMNFPLLRNLFVSKCPEMKSFSCRHISTPLLSTVITDITNVHHWDNISWICGSTPLEEHWDGDVNTTIRKLYECQQVEEIPEKLGVDSEEIESEESGKEQNPLNE